MALTTTATVKTLLGITGTAEDSKLDLLVNYADAAIKRYLGRDIESTSYPGAATNGRGDGGYYSGNGSRWLVLRQRPVTTLTSIYLDATGRWGQNPDGSFASATLLVAGTDYALDYDGYLGSAAASHSGLVQRIGGVWPQSHWYAAGRLLADPQPAQGNIKVAYTAGFSSVPADIAQAAALLVAFWRNIEPRGQALQSESLGAYSYSLASAGEGGAGLPKDVRRLLAPYREIRISAG